MAHHTIAGPCRQSPDPQDRESPVAHNKAPTASPCAGANPMNETFQPCATNQAGKGKEMGKESNSLISRVSRATQRAGRVTVRKWLDGCVETISARALRSHCHWLAYKVLLHFRVAKGDNSESGARRLNSSVVTLRFWLLGKQPGDAGRMGGERQRFCGRLGRTVHMLRRPSAWRL